MYTDGIMEEWLTSKDGGETSRNLFMCALRARRFAHRVRHSFTPCDRRILNDRYILAATEEVHHSRSLKDILRQYLIAHELQMRRRQTWKKR